MSYPGFILPAALSGHPALKAVSQAPVTGGFMVMIFITTEPLCFDGLFRFLHRRVRLSRPVPTELARVLHYRCHAMTNYRTYLNIGSPELHYKLTVALSSSKSLCTSQPGWLVESNIKPAILTVGGLFDAEDCYGAWNLYKAIEQKPASTAFNKV